MARTAVESLAQPPARSRWRPLVPRTLGRYLVKEIALYTALGVVGVGGTLVAHNAVRQLVELAGMGIQPGEMVQLLGVLAARFLTHAIPIALLFGVAVAVSRMSSDSETVAMQALGVGLTQIAIPVVVLGILATAATTWLLHDEPRSRRALRSIVSDIAMRGGLIEPGTFNFVAGAGRTLLVDERAGATLDGVVILDQSNPENPYMVMAQQGEFSVDASTGLGNLHLREGRILLDLKDTTEDSTFTSITFRDFLYPVDASSVLGLAEGRVRAKDMDGERLGEVLAHFERTGAAPEGVRDPQRAVYEVEYHRRRALAPTPLLFALVGLPLTLQIRRGARSWGALVATVIVTIYYVLHLSGTELALAGRIPAAFALWLPNALIAAAAGWLLWRARRPPA